jgi:hypothetical protein
LSGKHLNLNTGTDIIFAAISKPSGCGENYHNAKCGDTVVYG